jgi:DNA-binding SARP family transcriptional activator
VFWPDASRAQLRRNFRAALYNLRQALGQPGWVLFEDGLYMFNRSLEYWYDVEAFEQGLAAAHQLEEMAPERAVDTLAEAVRLYRGDLLQDVGFDEWALLRREELHVAYLTALATQGRLLFDGQEYARAADAYRRLLADDNLLESAHRALMRCHARLGERDQALRHFQGLVALLRDELGQPPMLETRELFQRLEAGQPI